MSSTTETYQNCEIRINNNNELFINGKRIDYEFDFDSNKWLSKYLPYHDYDSLLELARAIVRDTVEFTHVDP
ncbi:MAG: YggN family protein [Gammaproteobacteria bacterium]|nr:YggN family protein [Gammaproteobacteria bacterium]